MTRVRARAKPRSAPSPADSAGVACRGGQGAAAPYSASPSSRAAAYFRFARDSFCRRSRAVHGNQKASFAAPRWYWPEVVFGFTSECGSAWPDPPNCLDGTRFQNLLCRHDSTPDCVCHQFGIESQPSSVWNWARDPASRAYEVSTYFCAAGRNELLGAASGNGKRRRQDAKSRKVVPTVESEIRAAKTKELRLSEDTNSRTGTLRNYFEMMARADVLAGDVIIAPEGLLPDPAGLLPLETSPHPAIPPGSLSLATAYEPIPQSRRARTSRCRAHLNNSALFARNARKPVENVQELASIAPVRFDGLVSDGLPQH